MQFGGWQAFSRVPGAPGVAFTPGVLRVAAQVVSSVTETPRFFLRTRLGRDGNGRSGVRRRTLSFPQPPPSPPATFSSVPSSLHPPARRRRATRHCLSPFTISPFFHSPSKYPFGISSAYAIIILDIPLKAAFLSRPVLPWSWSPPLACPPRRATADAFLDPHRSLHTGHGSPACPECSRRVTAFANSFISHSYATPLRNSFQITLLRIPGGRGVPPAIFDFPVSTSFHCLYSRGQPK